jgi:hypothetical protein
MEEIRGEILNRADYLVSTYCYAIHLSLYLKHLIKNCNEDELKLLNLDVIDITQNYYMSSEKLLRLKQRLDDILDQYTIKDSTFVIDDDITKEITKNILDNFGDK